MYQEGSMCLRNEIGQINGVCWGECERGPPVGVAEQNVRLYCMPCCKSLEALILCILVSCFNLKMIHRRVQDVNNGQPTSLMAPLLAMLPDSQLCLVWWEWIDLLLPFIPHSSCVEVTCGQLLSAWKKDGEYIYISYNQLTLTPQSTAFL